MECESTKNRIPRSLSHMQSKISIGGNCKMKGKCILKEQLEDFASQKAHYLVEEKKI